MSRLNWGKNNVNRNARLNGALSAHDDLDRMGTDLAARWIASHGGMLTAEEKKEKAKEIFREKRSAQKKSKNRRRKRK